MLSSNIIWLKAIHTCNDSHIKNIHKRKYSSKSVLEVINSRFIKRVRKLINDKYCGKDLPHSSALLTSSTAYITLVNYHQIFK